MSKKLPWLLFAALAFSTQAFTQSAQDDTPELQLLLSLQEAKIKELKARLNRLVDQQGQLLAQGAVIVDGQGHWTGDVSGIRGPQGPQGDAGPKGHKGSDGERGPDGLAGDQGKSGPKGSTGSPGRTGDIGVRGPGGAQGKAGTCTVKGGGLL